MLPEVVTGCCFSFDLHGRLLKSSYRDVVLKNYFPLFKNFLYSVRGIFRSILLSSLFTHSSISPASVISNPSPYRLFNLLYLDR